MARWITSPGYSVAGQIIARERQKRQLTQREVAARLGMLPSAVAKIEKNQRRIDIVEMVALSRALGMDVTELFRAIEAELPEKLDL